MKDTISRALHVIAFVVAIGRRAEYDRPQVSDAAYDRAAKIAAELQRKVTR